MNTKNDLKQPGILVLLSTIVLSMVAFLLWILKLAPRSRGKTDEQTTPSKTSPYPSLPTNQPVNRSSGTVSPSSGVKGPTTGARGGAYQTEPTNLNGKTEIVAQDISTGISQATRWTATTRYMAGAGIILFIVWLIYFSRQTLSLLIFAALIALLAQPLIRYFKKRLHFSQSLSVVFTYLLIGLLIVVLIVLIIPNIIQGVNSLISYNWQEPVSRVAEILDQTANNLDSIPILGEIVSNSLRSLSDFIQNLTPSGENAVKASITTEELLNQIVKTIGFLANLVGPLFSGILSLIFMILISMQMCLASDQIRGWILNPVPNRFEGEISQLLDQIQYVWVSFLSGQFALMVIMGTLVWLMNTILGTPHALLLGILAGFLEIIPSLGPTLAAIPAAILALMFGSSNFPELSPVIFMLIVILGYVLLNLVENQYLVPQILGDAVSLPPLIVLIGVTIAGATAGIAGIFLATPLIATGKEILEYVYNKLVEEPDTGPPEVEKTSLINRVRGYLTGFRFPSIRRKKPIAIDPDPLK